MSWYEQSSGAGIPTMAGLAAARCTQNAASRSGRLQTCLLIRTPPDFAPNSVTHVPRVVPGRQRRASLFDCLTGAVEQLRLQRKVIALANESPGLTDQQLRFRLPALAEACAR